MNAFIKKSWIVLTKMITLIAIAETVSVWTSFLNLASIVKLILCPLKFAKMLNYSKCREIDSPDWYKIWPELFIRTAVNEEGSDPLGVYKYGFFRHQGTPTKLLSSVITSVGVNLYSRMQW